MLFFLTPARALDLDGDGMSDVWQRVHNIAIGDTSTDIDGDGHNNAAEAMAGTNPRDAKDYFRTFGFTVSPASDTVNLSWRSVEDRYYEIEKSSNLLSWDYASYRYGAYNQTTTSRTFTLYPPAPSRMFFRVRGYPEYDYDDDGDGLLTWEERLLGTDPYDDDTDYDGMNDTFEFIHALDPLSSADAGQDADGDQLTNAMEAALGLNPRMADTDGNGISDGDEDYDSDGLTNLGELQAGTDPRDFDSDDDFMPDGWEVQHQLDPTSPQDAGSDPDQDGLTNLQEYQNGTNPRVSDTDGDGVSDADEVASGANPADASDKGVPGGEGSGTVVVDMPFAAGGDYAWWQMTIEAQSPTDTRVIKIHSSKDAEAGYGEYIGEVQQVKLHSGNSYKVTMKRMGGVEDEYDGTQWFCWSANVGMDTAGGQLLPVEQTFYNYPESTTDRLADTAVCWTVTGVNQDGEKATWLVDNQLGLFTQHIDDYGKNVVQSLEATLLPVDIVVRKKGEAIPDNGVLIKAFDDVDIALSPSLFDSPNVLKGYLQWEGRHLFLDGSYLDWFELTGSTGTSFTRRIDIYGVKQLRVKIKTGLNTTSYCYYVRRNDANGGADSSGTYNPIYKKGELDYIGVCKNSSDLAIAEAARSQIGSEEWGINKTCTIAGGEKVAGAGASKCNIFVYSCIKLSDFSLPLDDGWPPRAHEWWFQSNVISGFKWIDVNKHQVSPGMVVSRYKADWVPLVERVWKTSAHVGILDYDGSWINAGSKNVNKYPHLTTKDYKPVHVKQKE